MYDEDNVNINYPEQEVDVPVTINVSWSNSEIRDQIVAKLTTAILKQHEVTIKQQVFNGLNDVVNDLLNEVIDQEVTLTDRFGKPLSEATSIRTLLMQSAEEWLTQKVDRYGHTDSRSYNRDQTRAQYLFAKATEESLEARVKSIIAQNIGDIDDLIAKQVKEQLRKAVRS